MKSNHSNISNDRCKSNLTEDIDASYPVTGSYIRETTGIINENVIQAILITGASRKEIKQACDLHDENYNNRSSFRKPASECVRRIYDLLDNRPDVLD